jgi:hypothetical protein
VVRTFYAPAEARPALPWIDFPPAHDAEVLARATLALPGSVKWALDHALNPTLQAEVPLRSFAETEEAQEAAARALEAAVLSVISHAAPVGAPDSGPAAEPCLSAAGLVSLCQEANWQAVPRDNGSVRVTLDVPAALASADISATPSAIRLWTEICDPHQFSDVQRRALAVMLLRANAFLRWVRGGFFPGTGLGVAGFEISIPAPATAATVAEALGALSVASRVCAREAATLADRQIAELFLAAATGWSPDSTTNNER